MSTTTTGPTPVTAPGDSVVPDDLGIAYDLGFNLGFYYDFDSECDRYNTVGELKRSYRKVLRRNSGMEGDWPRLVFAGVDGQKYAAEIAVVRRDVVVRPATADDLHQAEIEIKEETRSVKECVAKLRVLGYLPNE
jgi:hypothetical protein